MNVEGTINMADGLNGYDPEYLSLVCVSGTDVTRYITDAHQHWQQHGKPIKLQDVLVDEGEFILNSVVESLSSSKPSTDEDVDIQKDRDPEPQRYQGMVLILYAVFAYTILSVLKL